MDHKHEEVRPTCDGDRVKSSCSRPSRSHTHTHSPDTQFKAAAPIDHGVHIVGVLGAGQLSL